MKWVDWIDGLGANATLAHGLQLVISKKADDIDYTVFIFNGTLCDKFYDLQAAKNSAVAVAHRIIIDALDSLPKDSRPIKHVISNKP